MQETAEDFARLQAVLEASVQRAGEYLRSSFEMPEHSLSAGQLIAYLKGMPLVALATTTAEGAPRVAPLLSLFYRGEFYLPSVATAARARHVRQRPAVSLTHYVGTDLAILVHGTAQLVTPEAEVFAPLDTLQRASGTASVREWGEGVYLRIAAKTIYTYARYPEQFPEQPAPVE